MAKGQNCPLPLGGARRWLDRRSAMRRVRRCGEGTTAGADRLRREGDVDDRKWRLGRGTCSWLFGGQGRSVASDPCNQEPEHRKHDAKLEQSGMAESGSDAASNDA